MTETESQQNLEALRTCIKELDAIRAAVPDEFKPTGRPLPEMVVELAQAYRELQEQMESAADDAFERDLKS